MTSTIATTEARLGLQAALDRERSLADRNKMGQYATPPAMASDITKAVLLWLPDEQKIRFLEPAIGTGAFYEALLVDASERIDRAVGIELDPRMVSAARSHWQDHKLEVIEGDGTDMSLLESELFNLVITNPPYVRHHHLDPATKGKLRARAIATTGIEVSGLAGLYVHFMLANHAALAEGAVSSWLIPSEFMDVNYGKALLKYLTSNVTLLQIHRYDPSTDSFFDEALVSSAVVVFKATPPPEDHEALFTFGGSMTSPHQTRRIPITQLAVEGKWTRFPTQTVHVRSTHANPVKLGDLLMIKRGIATGDNGFFVMTRARAQELGLEAECLRPVLPAPRNLADPVVLRDKDGYPLVGIPLALIDCSHSSTDRTKVHPRLAAYLEAGEIQGVSSKYLTSKRKIWHAQEQRAVPPILCTYMGRGEGEVTPFRFIRNHSDAIATNGYLLLYPTSRFAEWLADRRDAPAVLDEIHRLLGDIDGHDLRAVGRIYGGGLRKVEPGELANLDVSAWFGDNSLLYSSDSLYNALFNVGQQQLAV